MNVSLYGVTAEFRTAEALIAAARKVRDRGFPVLETRSSPPLAGSRAALRKRFRHWLSKPLLAALTLAGGAALLFAQSDGNAFAQSLDAAQATGGWGASLPHWLAEAMELMVPALATAALIAFGLAVLRSVRDRSRNASTPAPAGARYVLVVRAQGAGFSADAACRVLLASGACSVRTLPES